MGVQYIFVNSQNKSEDEEISDFTINLHNPITNVKRVGVTSFTTTNASHNITENNKKVRWIEQKVANIEDPASGNQTRLMEIILDVGYYNINTLLSEITLKMSREEASLTRNQDSPSSFLARKFGSETLPTYSYNINENYEVSIFGSSTSSSIGDKFWGFYSPIKEMKSSLVHSILGFKMNKQITDIKNITNSNKAFFKTTMSSTETDLRSLRAAHSYSENSALLYLGSNTLSSNAFVSRNEGGLMTTMKTNILETIHVNVSRYSHIHLSKFGSDILWHDMDNVSLSHFDLKLMDEHHNINTEGVQNYKCCIIIETTDPDHREKELMYKEYNRQAYAMAHRL